MAVSEKQIVFEAINGLNQAIGASSQMIHNHRKLSFIDVRNALVSIKDNMISLAIAPLFDRRR